MNAPLKAKVPVGQPLETSPVRSGLARATEKLAAAGIGVGDLSRKLLFTKNLQHVANRIHSTQSLDDLFLEVSRDICRVFSADRLVIYVLSENKSELISKNRSGDAIKDVKLAVATQVIPGFVALTKTRLNIHDAHDDAEIKAIHPELAFSTETDKLTGYRSKQMLLAPIIGERSEVLGVIHIINSKLGQPFGAIEEDGLTSICETLAIAIRNRKKEMELQAPRIRTRYDALVADAVISAEEFKLAANSARRKAIDIESVLANEFQVSNELLGYALAKFYEVPYEPFQLDRVKPFDLLKLIKQDYVESAEWLPLEDGPQGLVILAVDPERIRSSRVIQNIFPRVEKVSYRVTTREEFKQTTEQFLGSEESNTSIDDLLSDLEEGALGITDINGSGSDDISAASDNELVKFVNKVIIDAYHQGASDIHIEPYPGKAKTEIRFRKDGTLSKYIEVPASYRSPLVTRLKIMCDLDISEKRKPQDGKIKFKKYGPLDIELRVATIPSAGGVEDIVMRILTAGAPIPVEKLGLTPHNLKRLKEVITKPYGLFFVCGPTGSGKTTTLHSILSHLNTPETKIWTAEDPVEITQKGLRQVQINRKAGLDFVTIMKSFLRADPDVIMVGEMRDKETVSTGIEASLTGHLVFATLHTNSAPESITRLLDMGMDPFNFSDALLGVLAQRLAKRLCECKEAYVPGQPEIRSFLAEYAEELKNTEAWRQDAQGEAKKLFEQWSGEFGKDGKLTFHRSKGCPKCNGSGYKGRVGLHELLIGTDALKKNIQEHARVSEMFTTAINEGMRTLKMDGMEKVLMGITDLKQVRAVCIK